MSGVAVAQPPIAQVEEAAERGDEHRRIGFFVQPRVDGRQHLRGIVLKCGVRTKKRFGHRHHERGAHAFAGDVADAEEEAIVVPREIVQIAADLFRRPDECVDREWRVVGQ